MTPPTAALPIADCPNKECRKKCEVVTNQGREARVQCLGGELKVDRCGYRGPSVQHWKGFKGHDHSDDSLRAEAIRLHNFLCAPAVQATADADVVITAEERAELMQRINARELDKGLSARMGGRQDVQIEISVLRKLLGRKAAAQEEDWKAKYAALYATINTPHTDEWFEAVRLEAGFQIERWGTEHDAGKAPMDWFWLIGYLAGKALASQLKGDMKKAKHHTISSGAALLNWFRAMTGDTNSMRPGHAPSAEAAGDTAAVSGEQEKERE